MISVFDVTPAIDVDCVDKEAILIVERDAEDVMVPAGEVLDGEVPEGETLALLPVRMALVPDDPVPNERVLGEPVPEAPDPKDPVPRKAVAEEPVPDKPVL